MRLGKVPQGRLKHSRHGPGFGGTWESWVRGGLGELSPVNFSRPYGTSRRSNLNPGLDPGLTFSLELSGFE
jgi:hypothetical protein